MTCFYHLHQQDDNGSPTQMRRLEGLLDLIDENLGELNEFKEISHNVDLAIEVVAKRMERIERRLEIIEDQIFKDGLTKLERKIMKIIKDETRKLQSSLIDYTTPTQEIKNIANIPRDNNTNTGDKTSD